MAICFSISVLFSSCGFSVDAGTAVDDAGVDDGIGNFFEPFFLRNLTTGFFDFKVTCHGLP